MREERMKAVRVTWEPKLGEARNISHPYDVSPLLAGGGRDVELYTCSDGLGNFEMEAVYWITSSVQVFR
jgi:hypothetical protein